MAQYIHRTQEPIPLVEKVRDLLEQAQVHLEPTEYQSSLPESETVSTVIDAWKDRPVYVDVTIRFRLDLRDHPIMRDPA